MYSGCPGHAGCVATRGQREGEASLRVCSVRTEDFALECVLHSASVRPEWRGPRAAPRPGLRSPRDFHAWQQVRRRRTLLLEIAAWWISTAAEYL